MDNSEGVVRVWFEQSLGRVEKGVRQGSGEKKRETSQEEERLQSIIDRSQEHLPKGHLPPRGGLSLQLLSTWSPFSSPKIFFPIITN